MDLIELIHKQAFENPIENFEVDLQGWCAPSFLETFANAIEIINKKNSLLIIEVGTWKGLSACTMAEHLKAKKIQGHIIGVDTWLGSPEHLTWLQNPLGKRVLGLPQLYLQFLKNVQAKDVVEYIYPLPISSAQGAIFFKNTGIYADIIYIDAGHEYECVKLDIELYWRILVNGGVMIFDDYCADYSNWPGVVQAVDEFAKANNLKVTAIENTAQIIKPITEIL